MLKRHISYVAYVLGSLGVLSVGANAYQAHKYNRMVDTIQNQLKGELSENARLLSEMRTEIGAVKSQMVTQGDLDKKSEAIISGLSQNTQEAIRKYQDETGAVISSISEKVTSMDLKLKGQGRVGSRPNNRSTATNQIVSKPPTDTPSSDWLVVTDDDINKCAENPHMCDPLVFSWTTPYGKPFASFTTDNLWAGDYSLDLKMDFKVVVIEYSEDQSNLGAGAVRNQGLHIMAGYINEKGEFVTLAEDKMYEGNPNLDSRLFYTPKVDPPSIKLRKLKLFEPSLLVGAAYLDKMFGFSVGASLLNIQGGDYRLGVQVVLNNKQPSLAGVMSYHPYILGKYLNVAPALGWAMGMDGSSTWLAALLFQVW